MLCSSGGGITVSLVGAELSNQQVSQPIFQAFNIFASWFKPRENATIQTLPPGKEVNFFEKFKKICIEVFEVAKEFFLSSFQWLKKDRKNLIPRFPTEQHSNDSRLPKIDWKDFFNGIWILWGFAYRDVFKVEFGTFCYLILNLLVDVKSWQWDKNSLVKAFSEVETRLEKGIKSFLFLLIQLNEEGKIFRRKISSGSFNKRIELKISNIEQAARAFNWVRQGDTFLDWKNT